MIIDLTETIDLLGGLLGIGGDGGYLGVFADETALNTAYPTAPTGSTATVLAPDGNLFWYDGAAWVDTGTGSLGDMLKAVYDPTGVNANAFSMGNMTETAAAKILTNAERLAIIANSAKQTNVTTNLSVTTRTTTALTVESSDGTNAIIPQATTLLAGLLTAGKLIEINNNSAKQTNVTTNLSVANRTANALDVVSSDGTDATIPQATISLAGLLIASDKVNLVTLTDGSNADGLHEHAFIKNPSGTVFVQAAATVVSIFTAGVERLRALANGDLQFFNYPDTRNDVTANDEKVLTTDASGNLLLRRVLPFSSIVTTTVGKLNQSTTLLTYHLHSVTIPEDGLYSLTGKYVWSHNSIGTDFEARVLLDGVATLVDHIQEPADTGGGGVSLERLDQPGTFVDSGTSQRYAYPIAEAIFLTAGAHTIEVQVAGETTNDEAAIYNCVTMIKRES